VQATRHATSFEPLTRSVARTGEIHVQSHVPFQCFFLENPLKWPDTKVLSVWTAL